jgi:ERCC4-related helicase
VKNRETDGRVYVLVVREGREAKDRDMREGEERALIEHLKRLKRAHREGFAYPEGEDP